MKTLSLYAAILVSVLLVGWFAISSIRNLHREAKYDSEVKACVAGQNEICPTAQWLKNFDDWQKLGQKITEETHSDQLVWNGEKDELQQTAPSGASFDVAKRKFIKNLPPASQPPAPAPTPGKK